MKVDSHSINLDDGYVVREDKFHWRDYEKKPKYDGYTREEMSKTLKPAISPTEFVPGSVRTTKFRNISYIVDFEYKGNSKTPTLFWNVVYCCPPCLDAEEYPFKYDLEGYHVTCDEQGNKFWSLSYGSDNNIPISHPRHYPEGTFYYTPDGTTWQSTRNEGSDEHYYGASWKYIEDDTECNDSECEYCGQVLDNQFPNTSIKYLDVGDIMTGEDENDYIVCKKYGIRYWKPYRC
jgi:hypothetical protein